MSLTCKGCLDYEDCPYHEPNGYTPYLEDTITVGCQFGYAKEVNHD